MKILITGMTSQHVNEKTRSGVKTLAGVMKETLNAMPGITATVGRYSIEHSIASGGHREYDFVIVGLGPLKGLGTSYCYQAIQAIHDYEDSVALYVDDTSTSKIGREFKTIIKRQTDYAKPFFMYKREWSYLEDMDGVIFKEHMNIVEQLAGGREDFWPLLVPSWTFDLGYTAGNAICRPAADKVISFDPSPAFLYEDVKSIEPDTPTWGTMWDTTSRAIMKMGVEKWPVENLKANPHMIAEMSGLLIPATVWTPDVQISVSLGVPVASDWRVLGPTLGEPFEALPASIELMSKQERDDLAEAQKQAINNSSSVSTAQALENVLLSHKP
ncbi:hypothetical protein PP301_gp053 [Gordonia phage GMA2]|uniref:Uncharacterized protein n=1 Tax=Gordonia phage GMA2 TaxID=1647283 RepID=A0A0K0N7F4_9CAUD|nr:hypothetical protein PP301_gp053 [Gordonia phage GMA2]AKJ72591.1 hypothetical protein GMA2_53 [Gordonia phage GMA2]